MIPIVSIITPYTAARADYMPRFNEMLCNQDYAGTIQWIGDNREGLTIGEKRNWCCEQAQGDVIIHMDDDDFYAKDWVSKSVEALLSSKADVTGLSKGYFINEANKDLYLFEYPPTMPRMLLFGATFCYHKSYWQKNKFLHISESEDNLFLMNSLVKVAAHEHCHDFLATIHDNNTSRRNTALDVWKLQPEDKLQAFAHIF